MKKLWDTNLLGRLLLPVVFISLLGITPQPRAAYHALQQARLSWEADHPASAAQYLAQTAQFFSWQPHLWETAGELALQAEAYDDAIRYFNHAGEKGNLSPQGILLLGDAYYQTGDLEAAIRAWERGGQTPELYRRLARVHRAAGDYQALIEDYTALLRFDPNDSASNYQLGLLHAALQPESAASYLQIASALNPEYAASTRRLLQAIRTAALFDEPAFTFVESGRVLASMDEWELAAQAFYRAVEARPDYAEALAFLGEAYQHIQDSPVPPLGLQPGEENQRILEHLEQAVLLDPQSIAANSLLGLYWQRAGEYDQALEYLTRAAELDPRNPAFQVELGNCQADKGDLIAALSYYTQAVQLAPQDSTYWRILALFSLRHQVQLREVGLPAARQAAILSPSDPLSLDLMGQVLSSLGDHANAERFFGEAIAQNPDYAPAYLHSGINFLVQGDAVQARQQLQTAYLLSPDTSTGQQAHRILQRYFP